MKLEADFFNLFKHCAFRLAEYGSRHSVLRRDQQRSAALALGIAGNTSDFTVVNTVILRPLPFPDSDRIVSIGR